MKVISLASFIKDDFVPEPKRVSKRNKALILDNLEDNLCSICGKPLENHLLNNQKPFDARKCKGYLKTHKKIANGDISAVDRWTRKISKLGLKKCLIELDTKWASVMESLLKENKLNNLV